MYCQNCGKELAQNANFCDACGAKTMHKIEQEVEHDLYEKDIQQLCEKEEEQIQLTLEPEIKVNLPESEKEIQQETQKGKADSTDLNKQGKQISQNMYLCPDGKYRWVYELHLLKSFSMFFFIWKIFFFICLGIFGFMGILNLIEGSLTINLLKIFGYFVLGMTALVGISYLIYSAIMGGKYCVLFEMDETGILHQQMPKQAKKATILGDIVALAGIATHNINTVILGHTVQTTEMYSEFSHVTKVKSCKKSHTIKVNSGLMHNQIYADTEDYAFVLQYIKQRCTKAKIK